MDKLLLTPEEAAEVLSLGRTKVFQLMGDGTLRSVRIGKCRRVPASALVELVDHLEDRDKSGVAGHRSVTPSS